MAQNSFWLKSARWAVDIDFESLDSMHCRPHLVKPMVDLPPNLEAWVTDILVWIGYGTVVGLLAKAIMPGRDPGGAVATLAMGIAGVIIGCGVWSLIGKVERVTPISSHGFVAGTLGAFVILLFYRILGGYWYEEPERPRRRTRRRGTRRRYRTADY